MSTIDIVMSNVRKLFEKLKRDNIPSDENVSTVLNALRSAAEGNEWTELVTRVQEHQIALQLGNSLFKIEQKSKYMSLEILQKLRVWSRFKEFFGTSMAATEQEHASKHASNIYDFVTGSIGVYCVVKEDLEKANTESLVAETALREIVRQFVDSVDTDGRLIVTSDEIRNKVEGSLERRKKFVDFIIENAQQFVDGWTDDLHADEDAASVSEGDDDDGDDVNQSNSKDIDKNQYSLSEFTMDRNWSKFLEQVARAARFRMNRGGAAFISPGLNKAQLNDYCNDELLYYLCVKGAKVCPVYGKKRKDKATLVASALHYAKTHPKDTDPVEFEFTQMEYASKKQKGKRKNEGESHHQQSQAAGAASSEEGEKPPRRKRVRLSPPESK